MHEQFSEVLVKFDPAHTALVMIDMQMGFVDPASCLCIAGAAASIPACKKSLDTARGLGLHIVHVRREYAADGSDVEPVRKQQWETGGRPLSTSWPESLEPPAELAALEGETILMKPRFSAFFNTDLHQMLQSWDVRSLVLTGTTTPNCIRTTCYDALSYNYDVAVISDATSSRTEEVQTANLTDMAFIGTTVLPAADLPQLFSTE